MKRYWYQRSRHRKKWSGLYLPNHGTHDWFRREDKRRTEETVNNGILNSFVILDKLCVKKIANDYLTVTAKTEAILIID